MKTAKELWIKANQDAPWENRKEIVTTALETGADVVVVNTNETKSVRELGKVRVAANDSDADVVLSESIGVLKSIKINKKEGKSRGFYREIHNKADEEELGNAGKYADYVIVGARDWKIIPLENLIAMIQNKSKIIFEVETLDDAKLALQTMEVGSDGVLVEGIVNGNLNVNNIKKIKEFIDEFTTEKIELVTAKVTKVKAVGMGDRVCVDTCSMLNVGEGMLIGSKSNGMFLVHSESLETPYVAPRPFRVNAGAVHSYIKVPGDKTRYLGELGAGDEVLAVDSKGKTRKVIVGRSKIEKRPLMFVEAEYEGKKFTTVLQNAETIRLVDNAGKAVSVVDLKVGSEVLVFVENIGRHFGMSVEESIEER